MKHIFYLQDEPGAKSVFSDVLHHERSSHLVKKRSIVLDEMALQNAYM